MATDDTDTDPGASVFIDPLSNIQTIVIALIPNDEFLRAQRNIPDLRAYADYDDWCESREGLRMGLAMAGIDGRVVPVTLTSFLAWCRLTGASPTERALDTFASTITLFKASLDPAVLAVTCERDFETLSLLVGACSTPIGSPEWLRNRQQMRIIAALSERIVERLSISSEAFSKWSVCVGQISRPTIDIYARLVLEHLAEDFKGAPSLA
jgi:hypothetical protein